MIVRFNSLLLDDSLLSLEFIWHKIR